MYLSKDDVLTIKINEAKQLLKRAVTHQEYLSQSSYSEEVIERSTPVLWFGESVTKNWVTIATNPSTREFLDNDNNLLLSNKARFYVRDKGVSLQEYRNNESALEKTVEMYNTYFHRETVYRKWFGKEHGANLEGLLNGMGRSLYSSNGKKGVIHTDFFPIATKNQMSKIKSNHFLLDSKFAMDFLNETLNLLDPSLLIVLGRDHCIRIQNVDDSIRFGEIKSIKEYPLAQYQIGFSSTRNIPIVGVHFKPSEQMLGLGNKIDSNGNKSSEYVRRTTVNQIGTEIMNNLKERYPNAKY